MEKEFFEINIDKCDDEQITMYDKDLFLYCENPICDNNCPIKEERAKCVKSNVTNINDKQLNHCECLPGYRGEKCDELVYAKIKYGNY